MMKKIVLMLIAMSLPSFAGSSYYSSVGKNKTAPVVEESCFNADELQFDLFASYTDPDGDSHDSAYGGGIGFNYFLSRVAGLGFSANWWDGGSLIHSLGLDIILRAPIESICAAPYILGGVGYSVNSVNQVTYSAGAGVEFRVKDNSAIFLDGKYVWADKTDDWVIGRLGLRFTY